MFSEGPEEILFGVSTLSDYDCPSVVVKQKYETYKHLLPKVEKVKQPIPWSTLNNIIEKHSTLFRDDLTRKAQDLAICNATGTSKCFGDCGLDVSISFYVYFVIEL